MPLDLSKRSFIIGALSALAAPAIVRAASLMPVRSISENIFAEAHWIEHIPMSPDMYSDLIAVTRKAFVPRLFVEIYRENPLLLLMHQLDAENA